MTGTNLNSKKSRGSTFKHRFNVQKNENFLLAILRTIEDIGFLRLCSNTVT